MRLVSGAGCQAAEITASRQSFPECQKLLSITREIFYYGSCMGQEPPGEGEADHKVQEKC